jgi:hypothetical protein
MREVLFDHRVILGVCLGCACRQVKLVKLVIPWGYSCVCTCNSEDVDAAVQDGSKETY